MYQLIDYYDPADASPVTKYAFGQIWWTCFAKPLRETGMLRMRRGQAQVPMDIRDFDPSKETADLATDTKPNEFMALCKFKQRPVVILSTAGTSFKHGSWEGGQRYLVAPVFTLRDDVTGEYKVPAKFVWGAIRYQWSSVFYIPEDNTYDIREAVILLDCMTTLQRSWLLNCRKACLSTQAQNCLHEWLRHYLYGTVHPGFNKELEEYRQMVTEDAQIRTGGFGQQDI